MKQCDLHTHSVFSDGTLTPAEILAEAERIGLSAVALCDHNTTAGLDAFLEAGARSPVTAVPGVEITAQYNGKEIHVVGLFLKKPYDRLNGFLAHIRQKKETANRNAYLKLTAAGYQISYETILKEGGENVNRLHFAKELIRRGYAASVDEAFKGLLSEEHGLYLPAERCDGFEVIAFLREISAVPVLAHPFLNLSYGQLQEFLPAAKDKGLLAMETYYPLFDAEQTRLAESLAAQYALLPSGGSDFHGANKPNIHLGTGKGNLCVPLQVLDAMAHISQ